VITDAPHAAVLAAWERSLFGVMPSLLPEPLGTVVLEAMRAGKAVIGTIPGGHSDMVVNGETGLLVPRGDVDALAAAMHVLLTDSELRERFGQAAAGRAVDFTADVSMPQLERVLEGLAPERRMTSSVVEDAAPSR